MTQADEERLWLLGRFPNYGWSSNCLLDFKKWAKHAEVLVAKGLLETDGCFYRVTDSGRSALKERRLP